MHLLRPAEFRANVDDLAKAIFQDWRSVGRSSLLLHVGEVECPYVDAGLCKPARNAGDEGMTLAGPGPVGKDDADVRLTLSLSGRT